MTKSNCPLFQKVVERLEMKGALLPPDVTSSYFVTNDSKGDAVVSQFWVEAHTLSCFKRGSFHSSVQATFHDTMSSLEDSNDVALDQVRNILAEKCALMESDGSTINSEVDTYTRVLCAENQMSNGQIKAIANLAASHLSNNAPRQPLTNTPAAASTSLLEYVASPIRNAYRGITKAIDSVLGDELPQRVDINESSELDDAIAAPKQAIDHVDEDDAMISTQSKSRVSHKRPLSNADAIISIDVIVNSCRSLLEYTNNANMEDNFFVLRDAGGGVDRIMLRKSGITAGSLGSLCHQAGKHYSFTNDNGLDHKNISKILSSVSEEEVNILTETLVAYNHAIVDETTITIFPKGVILNYTKCQSDYALFQIYTTRITIQNRMYRLEQDAKTAQQNAVNAKRNGMAKSALVHMKRRNIALNELERCATLISNLDASELRLSRAKNNAQLVETFALVKSALQDIRTDSGLDETNVEELMFDIHQEIDATNGIAALLDGAGLVIDDDQLNEEFKQLELAVAREKDLTKEDIRRTAEEEEQLPSPPSHTPVATESDNAPSQRKPEKAVDAAQKNDLVSLPS